MRILGRLMMAAAMAVPIGVVAAHPAGAIIGSENCTNTSGKFDVSPGLLLVQKQGETPNLGSTGLTCTGPATAGDLATTFGETFGNCSSIVGKQVNGRATVTWTAPVGMGKSTAKISLKITSFTGGTFKGVFDDKAGMLLHGRSFTGTFTTVKSLDAKAFGGDCTVLIPLVHLGISAVAFSTV